MRRYLFFFCLISSISSVLAADLKKVEENTATGSFYLLNGMTLATHLLTDSSDEFGELNKEKISRIRQVPVSFLEPIGLKENDKIQFVRFSDGKKMEYTLGKKVFILLFKTQSSLAMYKWGMFNLVLTNEPSEHKKLESLPQELPPKGDGIALNGKGFELIDGSYSKLGFHQLSAKDPDRKLFEGAKTDIKKANLQEAKLLVDFNKEGPWNTSILSTSKGSYFLEPVILSSEGGSLVTHVGTMIKGHTFLISTITPDTDCFRLYLLNRDRVSYKNFHCIPKNLSSMPE